MHINRSLVLKLYVFCTALLLVLAACGATPDQVAPQQTVTVSKKFQSQVSPIPPVPTYLCGAWSSNNAPGPNSTINIYARITKNLVGVNGATATAGVAFQGGDPELVQHPAEGNSGFCFFYIDFLGGLPGWNSSSG